MSGSISGVQARCKQENNNIFYIHCYAHCLNLALIDSICEKSNTKSGLKNSSLIFDFLGTVQFVYTFLENSAIRHAVLENIAKESGQRFLTLKSLSTTRWACRAEAVSSIKKNYKIILSALHNICDDCTIPEIRAKGLFKQLQTIEFIFSLCMMEPILQMILIASKSLQSSNLDLLTAVQLINSLKKSLISMRNSEQYDETFNKCLKICKGDDIEIPEVRNRKVSTKVDSIKNQHMFVSKSEELKVTVYYKTLDILINGLHSRFTQESLDMINAVGNMISLEIHQTNLYEVLQTIFLISHEGLVAELRILKSVPNGSSTKAVYNWLDFLKENQRQNVFPNFKKVLIHFATIPVTSCSCERVFSKLPIVKSKLRSTMLQERLESFLLLLVEQEKLMNVQIEEVIDEFKSMNNERECSGSHMCEAVTWYIVKYK
ncbi:unnamed protein product [Macrosiphum euphorbiae]|uniref:HAT C-terminal dimerisation domain-containing protein n=1 Tax=Macrosiphum euphorbiae TaxID=13131 RepID=A0AAV0WE85_9HEMI|nr:unnamed protein product [Macrosiphum euphorbiae]